MLTRRYRVMKFGGSSVGAPERLKRVTDLVARERELTPVAVVVSAMGDTTDWLIDAANASAGGNYPAAERQIEGIAALATDNGLGALRLLREAGVALDGEADVARIVAPLKAELGQILFGMRLLREKTPQSLDLVLSFGERISTAILAEVQGGARTGADRSTRTSCHGLSSAPGRCDALRIGHGHGHGRRNTEPDLDHPAEKVSCIRQLVRHDVVKTGISAV